MKMKACLMPSVKNTCKLKIVRGELVERVSTKCHPRGHPGLTAGARSRFFRDY
jgi:hypothetical protein